MFRVVLALKIWENGLENINDNLFGHFAVVHVISKTSSKDPYPMKLMRRLMAPSLIFNIHFHAENIQKLHNVAADLLMAYR